MPAVRRVLGLMVVLFFVASPLGGQTTEKGIVARLRDRPLYLRGFWSDETLHFDGNGELVQPSAHTTFTLDGFAFESVKLKDGLLTVRGQVICVEFLDGRPKRMALPVKRIILIEAPANGDYGPALDAIFADGLEALAPSLPAYWQTWARKTYPAVYASMKTPAPSANETAFQSPPALDVGGSISAPRLLHSVVPHSNGMSPKPPYSCKTTINLVVERNGNPSHITIAGPVGLGLDESALQAVQQWHFEPAKQDGAPVRVNIAVEVNYIRE